MTESISNPKILHWKGTGMIAIETGISCAAVLDKQGIKKLVNFLNAYRDEFEIQEVDLQAERDDVLDLLDDLRKYADGEYSEAGLSDNEHDMRIHLEYENRIWGIMKELRQQGGEQP